MAVPQKSKTILYTKEPAFVFSHDDWVETISRANAPEDQIVRATSAVRTWFSGQGKFEGASSQLLKAGFEGLEAQL